MNPSADAHNIFVAICHEISTSEAHRGALVLGRSNSEATSTTEIKLTYC